MSKELVGLIEFPKGVSQSDDLVGYGLGRAFIYGTPAVAIMKIPFDVIAAIIGLGLAYYIYFHTGFVKQFKKVWDEK